MGRFEMYKQRGNGPVWSCLMIASFVILIFVFIKYGDTDKILEENTTFAGNYYEPATYSKAMQAADQIYAQMAGSYSLGCPCKELKDTGRGLALVNNLESNYSKMCMFVPVCQTSPLMEQVYNKLYLDKKNVWLDSLTKADWETNMEKALQGDTSVVTDAEGYYRIQYLLGINPEANSKMKTNDVYLYELFPYSTAIVEGAAYVEIIAPFDFSWVNNNTDGETNPERIEILNSAKDIRMTFDNCANWFCAGPPGTSQYAGQEFVDGDIEDVYADWSSHGRNSSPSDEELSTPHYTIFGSSSNAELSGGSYGKVIGYADNDTTVKIEYLTDSGWIRISLSEWLVNK